MGSPARPFWLPPHRSVEGLALATLVEWFVDVSACFAVDFFGAGFAAYCLGFVMHHSFRRCEPFTSFESGSLMPIASLLLRGFGWARFWLIFCFLEAGFSHCSGLSCLFFLTGLSACHCHLPLQKTKIWDAAIHLSGSMCCFPLLRFVCTSLAGCAPSHLKGDGNLRNRLLSF